MSKKTAIAEPDQEGPGEGTMIGKIKIARPGNKRRAVNQASHSKKKNQSVTIKGLPSINPARQTLRKIGKMIPQPGAGPFAIALLLNSCLSRNYDPLLLHVPEEVIEIQGGPVFLLVIICNFSHAFALRELLQNLNGVRGHGQKHSGVHSTDNDVLSFFLAAEGMDGDGSFPRICSHGLVQRFCQFIRWFSSPEMRIKQPQERRQGQGRAFEEEKIKAPRRSVWQRNDTGVGIDVLLTTGQPECRYMQVRWSLAFRLPEP